MEAVGSAKAAAPALGPARGRGAAQARATGQAQGPALGRAVGPVLAALYKDTYIRSGACWNEIRSTPPWLEAAMSKALSLSALP
jgi:hypothetical protein